MLKYRLIFGTLMTIGFITLILFDGWLDGSLNSQTPSDIQATLLAIFLIIVAFPVNLEFAALAANTGAKIFLPITITASILLSTSWYWAQFFETAALFFTFIICFSALAIFLWQGIKYASVGAFANCGANLLAIIYLGVLTSFIMAIRVEFGPIIFLMFIFVIKCSDIGAYTLGRLFGKHKFSPVISPKKTWEGMGGAVLFAVVVASIFALVFDIMPLWLAAVFGVVFAFIGQLGDLAESMFKRAAEQKDSSSIVPGFGGILDVIDSPLGSAVFAYLFFRIVL